MKAIRTCDTRHGFHPARIAKVAALQPDNWQAQRSARLARVPIAGQGQAQSPIVGSGAGHGRHRVVRQEFGCQRGIWDAVDRIPGHTKPAQMHSSLCHYI